MMDVNTLEIVGKLLAVLALVLANGFFVSAEFALVSLRSSRIDELIRRGHPIARALRRATDKLDANLAATQLGINDLVFGTRVDRRAGCGPADRCT